MHPRQLDLTHAGALIALCWPAGRAYPAIASSISSTLVGSVRSPPGPSLRPSLLSSSEATETKRSLSCIAALHSKLRFRDPCQPCRRDRDLSGRTQFVSARLKAQARWRARHGCASRAVLCCALCEYRLSASSLHRCPAPVRARPPWRSQWPTQQPCPCRGLSRTRSWSRKHGHTLQQATRYACRTHHHSVPCVRALKYAVGATYMLCAS